MSKNLCGKMRPANNPYEIWQAGNWTWHVLKKYQTPEKEAANPYARWFCLVKTPIVPEGELGDTYVKDITSKAVKIAENP
jgi:hypothetical protein